MFKNNLSRNPGNIVRVSSKGVGAFLFSLCFVLVFCAQGLQAQDNRNIILFREDDPKNIRTEQQNRQRILSRQSASKVDDLKFTGKNVQFDNQEGALKLDGGVVASSRNFNIQADRARLLVGKKEGSFSGDVFIGHPQFTLSCSDSYLNVPHEVGVFKDVNMRVDEIDFSIDAETVMKYSEYGYRMYDAEMSTCDPDLDPLPWKIWSDTIDFTENGYAKTYWTGLSFYGVPVMYLPAAGFPVKQDRASGLLVPEFGYGNQDGFRINQPLHIVLDESTDFTLSPFFASATRYGLGLEVRKAYSLNHSMETRWIYSDESRRDGDLRGLVAPEDGEIPFDEQRFGGFYYESWSSGPEAEVPLTYVADIHYVSDDLILRELPDEDIGVRNAPFTSSRVLGTVGLGSWGVASVFGEYNQQIDGNLEGTDDRVLHRLPEANVRLNRSFRPFGFNPYGIKLVTRANMSLTNFMREEGVDGTRVNFSPEVQVPFHYKNYISGGIGVTGYDTRYSLDDFENVDGLPLDTSQDRQTYVVEGRLQTAVEKVYPADPDGFWSTLSSIGVRGAEANLTRLKHVFEPSVNMIFAPDVDQTSLPLFDGLDRIRHRSVVRYGFTSQLFGKLEPAESFRSKIEELTPALDEIPELAYYDSLVGLRRPLETIGNRRAIGTRVGRVQSLSRLSIFQAYDYVEAEEDNDPIREPFSDIGIQWVFSPNQYLSTTLRGNYRYDRQDFSSWGADVQLTDDRGDLLSIGYDRFNPLTVFENEVLDGDSIENIDGRLEFVLTDQLKLGYYARYDGQEGEFIDQLAALRFSNECDCWRVDIGFSDRTNPDRQQLTVRLTLVGLGDLNQRYLYRDPQDQTEF